MRWRLTILTGLVSVLAASAFAQGLADAAARERERRKKQPQAKVYTESELRTSGRGNLTGLENQAPQGEASPQPAAAPGGAAKSEDETRAEQETAWREKLQQANQDVERFKGQVASLQRDLNDLSGNIYGAGRTKLLNELEAARKRLADAEKRVADLQEEGRRSRFR